VKQLLREQGIDFETVNYMEERLSADDLKHLLRAAGISAFDAIRKNEPAYSQFIAGKDLPEDQLILKMAKHPELIQRPIVVKGKKAVLARPSERLKELGIKTQ
jgi:arsenate reductase